MIIFGPQSPCGNYSACHAEIIEVLSKTQLFNGLTLVASDCDNTKCSNIQLFSGNLDIISDHAVICHGRGDAISRHDKICDGIASACSAANLSPVIEKRNLFVAN